jgi:hypothetical protein
MDERRKIRVTTLFFLESEDRRAGKMSKSKEVVSSRFEVLLTPEGSFASSAVSMILSTEYSQVGLRH